MALSTPSKAETLVHMGDQTRSALGSGHSPYQGERESRADELDLKSDVAPDPNEVWTDDGLKWALAIVPIAGGHCGRTWLTCATRWHEVS